ncbi:MAG: Stp1/IreP family PP2C-type Ser/Thr phosphatase [Acidobacteria bacterium]|nr:Stp1/IreP family PP2C-type Ser/Thr phosphatase [Acidobacteriota bacterium]
MKKEKKASKGSGALKPRLDVVVSVQSDKGCVREGNEDSAVHVKPDDPAVLQSKGSLIIVADGMGGHASGEVASQMAVEVVNSIYYQAGNDASQALAVAIREANRRIYAASQKDEKLRGMGTTCTALVLQNGSAYAAHVGDSRLYMVRDGKIYLMTEDHSMVMEMVKRGMITMEEARHRADKNVILRALGTAPEVEVSTWEEPLPVKEGDQYLLCSDGLYDLIEDEEIKQALVSAPDPQAACESLIALAKERGGHDNITVAVASIRRASA